MKQKNVIILILSILLVLGISPVVKNKYGKYKLGISSREVAALSEYKSGACHMCGSYYPQSVVRIECYVAALTICIDTACQNGICDYP